jgi:predicted CoA-binding protein
LALGLSPRQKQTDIEKAACRLAAEMPYQTASELFQELTGLSLSDHTAHEMAAEVARDLTMVDVFPSAKEIREKVAEVAKEKTWRPILVLGIDGAHVPTRPESAKESRPGRKNQRARRAKWKGQWQEAKGFRLYLVDGPRIVHLASWHQIQTHEELGEALRICKADGFIPEDRVRLCVVGDGAPWIWELIKEVFPSAVEVLDFYHCSEHLSEVAALQYPDDREYQQHWVESAVVRLLMNEGHSVIWGLQRMKPRSEKACEEITKLIKYLKKHIDRINYKSLRKGGYPIGSGGIESSNKFICHVRLKRSGAWWYVGKANDMLALRCAKYNGTFDRLFKKRTSKPPVKNA